MIFNKILVLAVLITVHLTSADITLSNLNDEKVIIKTSTNYYVLMNREPRKFEITCSKLKVGEFTVLVNNFKPVEKICNSYIPGFPLVDFYCSSKTYEFDLTNISVNSDHYTISCSTVETPESVENLKLFKLCKFTMNFKQSILIFNL
jgi:hypothetical protein